MATLLGTLFLGAAGLVSSVIGFATFLYRLFTIQGVGGV